MIGSLLTFAGLELREVTRRNLRAGLLLLGAVVLLIGASGYGLSALTRMLAEQHGPINADLMVGAGLLVVGLLIALGAWLVHRRRRSRETRAALAMAAAPLALGLGRKLAPSLLKVAPLVLLAGILAGRVLSSREE